MVHVTADFAPKASDTPVPQTVAQKASRERLAPARGILLGLAISAVFWVGLGLFFFL